MPGPKSILSWLDNFSTSRFPRFPDPAATTSTMQRTDYPPAVPPRYETASESANRITYDHRGGPSIQSPQPASGPDDIAFTPEAFSSAPVADYSVVSDQPLMSPAMSFNGLPPPSVSSFPHVRGPNLSKLTEGTSHLLCAEQ